MKMKHVNSYYAVLIITVVASFATLMLVRTTTTFADSASYNYSYMDDSSAEM